MFSFFHKQYSTNFRRCLIFYTVFFTPLFFMSKGTVQGPFLLSYHHYQVLLTQQEETTKKNFKFGVSSCQWTGCSSKVNSFLTVCYMKKYRDYSRTTIQKANYYPTIHLHSFLGAQQQGETFLLGELNLSAEQYLTPQTARSPSDTLLPDTLPLDLLSRQSCPDTIRGE